MFCTPYGTFSFLFYNDSERLFHHSCNSCSFIIQLIFSFMSLPKFSMFLPIFQLCHVLFPSAHLNDKLSQIIFLSCFFYMNVHFVTSCFFCQIFINEGLMKEKIEKESSKRDSVVVLSYLISFIDGLLVLCR